jgi:hypothetical protein
MHSTSQEILREIAKDGNPAAIATLLNQLFQPHQVTVKASGSERCLKIDLVSEEITDKSTLLFLLMQEINHLIIFRKFLLTKLKCIVTKKSDFS